MILGFQLFGWGGAIAGLIFGPLGGYIVFGMIGGLILTIFEDDNWKDLAKGLAGIIASGAALWAIIHFWNVR